MMYVVVDVLCVHDCCPFFNNVHIYAFVTLFCCQILLSVTWGKARRRMTSTVLLAMAFAAWLIGRL